MPLFLVTSKQILQTKYKKLTHEKENHYTDTG